VKFSEAWLRAWVNPDLDRETLLKQLTMAGLEVDGVEPVAGTFSGVVVGRVESCEQHPNADKLSLCTVNDGEETVQVICGAPNVREGLITAFAKVGAVLPGDFKIKKAKLRGSESRGMLCSASELGLGDDHDGIVEFPTSFEVGAELATLLDIEDATIEVDLTPNRGDCLGLKGLAREVGVLNNLAVNYPEIAPIPASVEDTFPVTLSAPEACPRYLGRVIRGIDLSQPSPFWMRERLRRSGLRSIDPVVDVTNYVMIELGQPMHAFDMRMLSEGIDVRFAQNEEKLTLLDGQEVELDQETLVIADGSGPVAIAGVMGGERSGVQDDTIDVFLECAFFSPLAIAGTARRYGLHTDASHRYERGVDWQLQFDAVERATQLLLEIVGGSAGPLEEAVHMDSLPQSLPVSVRASRIDSLLGVAISPAQVDEAFARLGFDVIERSSDNDDVVWTIASPSHRFDIAIEADLVEEICRIYGYNNIPVKRAVAGLELREVALEQREEPRLKNFMADAGFQEVITYTFVDPQLQDLLDPHTAPLRLENPMSSEQSVMRTNLLVGLVEAARANQARQQDGVRLFEMGLQFRPGLQAAGEDPAANGSDGLQQEPMLAGLLWGRRQQEIWHAEPASVDYFDVKGVVDQLLAFSGVANVNFVRTNDPVLHPGQSALIQINGVTSGRLGRLHPEIERTLDLEGVYVFELPIAVAAAAPKRVHTTQSRYPAVRRDLAIVVAQDVEAQQVDAALHGALGDVLVDFRLFDVYEGKGIDSNEKSLGLGLTLQSQEATLNESEIGRLMESAMSALEEQFGARLR